jgi:signal peptidase II
VSPGSAADRPAAAPGSGPAAGHGLTRPLLTVLALAAAVAAADQGSKLWALSRLAGRAPIALPGGWVDLRLVSNPGAAFSIGSGWTWVFTLCATAAVLIVPWFAARARSPGQAAALGLLLGGAAANLLDRLFRAPGPGAGRVVDFIDYHGWFIGNVADIAIVASVGILIMRAMTVPGREHRVQAARSGHAGRP